MGQFEAFVGVNFWTALFILLNTLIIFFVAKKFLFKPVMKIIQDRQQEIDDMYAKAGQAKEEASALRASLAMARISRAPPLVISRLSLIFSVMVKPGISMNSWCTMPMPSSIALWGFSIFTGSPLNSMVPPKPPVV